GRLAEIEGRKKAMSTISDQDGGGTRPGVKKSLLGSVFAAAFAAMTLAAAPASAQQPAPAQQKPNILFIMGDDIGLYQPSIYHRGLMVGETPNIDRIGNEGAIFTHYYAEQSC